MYSWLFLSSYVWDGSHVIFCWLLHTDPTLKYFCQIISYCNMIISLFITMHFTPNMTTPSLVDMNAMLTWLLYVVIYQWGDIFACISSWGELYDYIFRVANLSVVEGFNDGIIVCYTYRHIAITFYLIFIMLESNIPHLINHNSGDKNPCGNSYSYLNAFFPFNPCSFLFL